MEIVFGSLNKGGSLNSFTSLCFASTSTASTARKLNPWNLFVFLAAEKFSVNTKDSNRGDMG